MNDLVFFQAAEQVLRGHDVQPRRLDGFVRSQWTVQQFLEKSRIGVLVDLMHAYATALFIALRSRL